MIKLMQKFYITGLLPLSTGLLLGVSAMPLHLYFLSFVALIPLLFAADYVKHSKRPLLIYSIQVIVALLTFFLMGLYWVLKTANSGFLLALIIVVPFVLIIPYYVLLRRNDSKFSGLYFIAAWITVEMIMANFKLGSPFYNLGNNLGANAKLIQWYEFTGSSGGTLWILGVNFLLYSFIKNLRTERKQILHKSLVLLIVAFLPIFTSLIIYSTYREKGVSKEVLVIHPSTDNRDVKYRVNIYELMDIYLNIMLPQITEKTEYVVLPETAITNAGWIKDFNRNLVFNYFYKHTDSFPDLKLVTGAIAYEEIPDVEKIKHYKKIPGIRYSENYKTWYYTYNAALQIEKSQAPQIRAKEELVPYQEFAPYPLFMPRLSPVGIDFQFSEREQNLRVFRSSNGLKSAALICYEVIYNKLFYKASREGAQVFFVMLNEGWYESPNVSKQFLQHSVIKAVENRRGIAHSSNMGISAIINQRGDILATTESKEAFFLQQDIKLNRTVTLAARLGNYIEIIALLTTICLFAYSLLFHIKKLR